MERITAQSPSPPAIAPPPHAVSAVILNWARPRNIDRILASLASGGVVDDVIVWNNRAESPYWPHPPATGSLAVRVVNCSADFGLYTRFAAGLFAKNECVLIQDDDIELPAASLSTLYSAWTADPLILHGIFGRAPRHDGSYARAIRGEAECPVVLTRAVLTHRSNFAEFFRLAPMFDEIQRNSQPHGNGEDIIFSYVAMNRSGRKNRIHSVAKLELPDTDSMNGRDRAAHVAHRSRVLRACEAWLSRCRCW